MVKRAPSAARVEALPPDWQAAPLPPGPPSRTVRPQRPPRRETLVGRCLSWGLLRAPARSAWRHGGSATTGLGLESPASPLARRASAAAVAAPEEPPPRTVPLARAGRGGGERRGFEVCGAPAGSPRHGATLVAPGLPEGVFTAATGVAGAGPRRPQNLSQHQE